MDICENIATTPEEWVAKACETGETKRAFLKYTHVINGIAYASDARRMHWAESNFPDGVYDPISWMPVPYMGSAIDWDRIKFEKLKPDFTTYTNVSIEAVENCGLGPNSEECLKIAGTIRIRKSYLLDAMNGYLDAGVYYRSARVAGVSTFGHFIIAQISPVNK